VKYRRLNINGDKDRLKILRWEETHADIAMTLDVPTGPVQRGGYKFKTSADCLAATIEHLQFFEKHIGGTC
jgi:hypothetical protein